MAFSSRILLAVVVLPVLTGCATVMKPIHPSAKADIGAPVTGVRFDAEEVSFREPAIPVSSGNIWKREVASYTADTLNDLVDADGEAPVARTVVTFEMHGPSMVQFGTWKEMTVRLVTTLPDGRVVRSEPRSEYLDSNIEYVASQCLVFGGPVLDIAAFVLAIYLFTTGALTTTNPAAPVFCGCLVGLALVGVGMNLAQGGLQYVIAALEERRWSDLYLEALKLHADDVRATLATRAPPVLPASPDAVVPLEPAPPAAPGDAPPPVVPSEPSVPPPPAPLLDPDDVAPDGALSFAY